MSLSALLARFLPTPAPTLGSAPLVLDDAQKGEGSSFGALLESAQSSPASTLRQTADLSKAEVDGDADADRPDAALQPERVGWTPKVALQIEPKDEASSPSEISSLGDARSERLSDGEQGDVEQVEERLDSATSRPQQDRSSDTDSESELSKVAATPPAIIEWTPQVPRNAEQSPRNAEQTTKHAQGQPPTSPDLPAATSTDNASPEGTADASESPQLSPRPGLGEQSASVSHHEVSSSTRTPLVDADRPTSTVPPGGLSHEERVPMQQDSDSTPNRSTPARSEQTTSLQPLAPPSFSAKPQVESSEQPEGVPIRHVSDQRSAPSPDIEAAPSATPEGQSMRSRGTLDDPTRHPNPTLHTAGGIQEADTASSAPRPAAPTPRPRSSGETSSAAPADDTARRTEPVAGAERARLADAAESPPTADGDVARPVAANGEQAATLSRPTVAARPLPVDLTVARSEDSVPHSSVPHGSSESSTAFEGESPLVADAVTPPARQPAARPATPLRPIASPDAEITASPHQAVSKPEETADARHTPAPSPGLEAALPSNGHRIAAADTSSLLVGHTPVVGTHPPEYEPEVPRQNAETVRPLATPSTLAPETGKVSAVRQPLDAQDARSSNRLTPTRQGEQEQPEMSRPPVEDKAGNAPYLRSSPQPDFHTYARPSTQPSVSTHASPESPAELEADAPHASHLGGETTTVAQPKASGANASESMRPAERIAPDSEPLAPQPPSVRAEHAAQMDATESEAHLSAPVATRVAQQPAPSTLRAADNSEIYTRPVVDVASVAPELTPLTESTRADSRATPIADLRAPLSHSDAQPTTSTRPTETVVPQLEGDSPTSESSTAPNAPAQTSADSQPDVAPPNHRPEKSAAAPPPEETPDREATPRSGQPAPRSLEATERPSPVAAHRPAALPTTTDQPAATATPSSVRAESIVQAYPRDEQIVAPTLEVSTPPAEPSDDAAPDPLVSASDDAPHADGDDNDQSSPQDQRPDRETGRTDEETSDTPRRATDEVNRSSAPSPQPAAVSDQTAQSSAVSAPDAPTNPLSERPSTLDSALELELSEALSDGDWNEAEADATEANGLRSGAETVAPRSDVRAAQSAPQARSAAFSTRWAPVVAEIRASLSSGENGWQQMQIELDGGGGSVTVRARRDAERVIVSVGFTDPSVRAQAMASADRLHESLQAEFGSNVDFSFDAQANTRDESTDRSPHSPSTTRSRPDARAALSTAPTTARPTLGAQASREWVG